MASSLARECNSDYLSGVTEQALYSWGWAALSMCKVLLGRWGKQWPRGGGCLSITFRCREFTWRDLL